MSKLTLSNAQAIREVMQASVKTNCEPQFLHRLHCTLLIAEGRSCCEVARWFGKHPRTIERWVHALDLHGLEGLRDHHAGGRPAKLTGETAQRLALDLQKATRRVRISEVGMERKASDAAPGDQLRDHTEFAPMPAHASACGHAPRKFLRLECAGHAARVLSPSCGSAPARARSGIRRVQNVKHPDSILLCRASEKALAHRPPPLLSRGSCCPFLLPCTRDSLDSHACRLHGFGPAVAKELSQSPDESTRCPQANPPQLSFNGSCAETAPR